MSGEAPGSMPAAYTGGRTAACTGRRLRLPFVLSLILCTLTHCGPHVFVCVRPMSLPISHSIIPSIHQSLSQPSSQPTIHPHNTCARRSTWEALADMPASDSVPVIEEVASAMSRPGGVRNVNAYFAVGCGGCVCVSVCVCVCVLRSCGGM